MLTQDATLPRAEAFAVRDGRVVEIGGSDEVLWLREPDGEVRDLGGRCVIPGFVDPHNHLSLGALDGFWADCRGAERVEEIQRRLAAAARATPDGFWVRGFGYDHATLAGRRHPTRGDLDEAVPGRPALLLHYSHHQAVANSPALATAGITRGTPDPPGGEIARDRAGEPTGLLFERAMGMAETLSRAGWEERFVDVARAASLRYAAHGITAIQDAAVMPAMSRRYAEARQRGVLAIHVEEAQVGARGWFDPPDDAGPGAWLKLFVDGGYRCAMRLGQGAAARTGGFLFYEPEELTARLVAAWRRERRVVCHAIGNLGVATAVRAIEAAFLREPAGRGRVRLDHAMFLERDLVARLADLDVWVVAQPSFLYDSGGVAPSPEVMLRPFRTVDDAGIAQAFSSDFPCGSLAPLAGISAAVTRRSRAGVLAAPEEAITVARALAAYTRDAAACAGLGAERGSLEVGKRADFVVLSADPLAVPAEELSTLQVLETWVGGEAIRVSA